jgi:arginine/serine-rich splicing factor 16
MPWQGQKENIIDRFDGRAHLDYIPEVPAGLDSEDELDRDELRERRYINYERYRILVQNDFLKSKSGSISSSVPRKLH